MSSPGDKNVEATRRARLARFQPQAAAEFNEPEAAAEVNEPEAAAEFNEPEAADESCEPGPSGAAAHNQQQSSVPQNSGSETCGYEQQQCRILVLCLPNMGIEGLMDAVSTSLNSFRQSLLGGGAQTSSVCVTGNREEVNHRGNLQLMSGDAQSANGDFFESGGGSSNVAGRGTPEMSFESEVIVVSSDDSLPEVPSRSTVTTEVVASSPAACDARTSSPVSPSSQFNRPLRAGTESPTPGPSGLNLVEIQRQPFLNSGSAREVYGYSSFLLDNQASPLSERMMSNPSSMTSQRGRPLTSSVYQASLDENLGASCSKIPVKWKSTDLGGLSRQAASKLPEKATSYGDTLCSNADFLKSVKSNSNVAGHGAPVMRHQSEVILPFSDDDDSLPDVLSGVQSTSLSRDARSNGPMIPMWLSTTPPPRAQSASPQPGPSGVNSGRDYEVHGSSTISWNTSASHPDRNMSNTLSSSSLLRGQSTASSVHKDLYQASQDYSHGASHRGVAGRYSSRSKGYGHPRYASCALEAAAASAASAAHDNEDVFSALSPRESGQSDWGRRGESEEEVDSPAPLKRKRRIESEEEEDESPAPPKRKRRIESEEEEDESPAPPKRKRGRPKGSKTMKKKEAAIAKKIDNKGCVCNICKEGDSLQVTACGHLFHAKCLDDWVKISKQVHKRLRKCPLCGREYAGTFPFFG